MNKVLSTSYSPNKKLNLFICLIAVLMLGYVVKYRFSGVDGRAYTRSIDGDAKGYYAYLPAVFIYHDLTFSFFDKNPEKLGFSYSHTFLLNHDTKNLNKYTCGEAILLIPFFLMAMLYSWVFYLPMDGYNGAFHVFCVFGSWFYFIVGLYFTKKFLQQYFLSTRSIMLSLAGIALGTNLLNYVANESCMSHVFSFAIIALHAFIVKKYFSSPSFKKAIVVGITLGLIILIRPINGIIVFSYPFLAGGFSLFFFELRKNLKYFLCAGIFAGLVVFVQLVLWKLEIGNFIVYGYKNEGFYFTHPHIIDYLFSFKRGAFIYSPVLFFIFGGLFSLRNDRQQLLWLSVFLLIVFYIHASWWSWYYGDGLGERPLIDFYVFFALLIAFAFNAVKKVYIRFAFLGSFFLSVLLYQVFFIQYVHGIIHPYSMNFEKFSHVFLKTSDKYRNLYKCESEDFYHPHGIVIIDSVRSSLIDTNATVNKKLYYNKKNIHQQNYYDAGEIYPFTYEIITDSSWLFKPRYAEIDFDYMQPTTDSAASNVESYVTMELVQKHSKYYNANPVADRLFNIPGVWQHNFERIQIGISENPGDIIHIFIDNHKNKKFFIKNLKIKIVEAKT